MGIMLLTLEAIAGVSQPSTGFGKLFFDSVTKQISSKNDANVVVQYLTGAASAAPDGFAMYGTPLAANNAVVPVSHFITLQANGASVNVNTVQPIFNSPANGTITLPANTSYLFEELFVVTTVGAGNRTLAIAFVFSSAPTSITYMASINLLGATSYLTLSNIGPVVFSTVATATVVTGAIAAAAYNIVFVKGMIRTNLATTLIPSYQWSTVPGTSSIPQLGSYFKMTPIGNGSVVSVGQWS